jgi:hypothetical protein
LTFVSTSRYKPIVSENKSIMSRLTYFLLILVLGTLDFSLLRPQHSAPSALAAQKRPDYRIVNERFPTADYTEPDLPDPEKNAKRKEKQKRYNDGEWVFTRVNNPEVEESALSQHISFPPLPVNESEIIVIGTIFSAEAHLSESKRNIFSEFTLSVENVLKSPAPGLAQGSVLTIDRLGGHVRYPNGQRVRYRFGTLNMPYVGARYLFFLTSKHNKQDLSIVTAYVLTQDGTIPLDELHELRDLPFTTESELLKRVRELIETSAR